MTKTSVDVYVLFTHFVGLTNVYEVLLIIFATQILICMILYKKEEGTTADVFFHC